MIDSAKTVGMVGILGSGMRGLAYLLSNTADRRVVGFDDAFEELDSLPANDPEFVKSTLLSQQDMLAQAAVCDVLIFSDAVPVHHPVREQASRQGVPQLSYQEALGEFSESYTTIAVAGTHGKSSTAAFLAHICLEAGLDPTVLLGAAMPSLPGRHARVGEGKLFIVEADEYREHFLYLHPQEAIVTSIDYDHPDVFADLEEVAALFRVFVSEKLKPQGRVVTTAAARQLLKDSVTDEACRVVDKEAIQDILPPLPGYHMQLNAALSVTMAELLGIPSEQGEKYLASFPGLSRRFEKLGTFGPLIIISDYGHHPAAVAATLAAARQCWPQKRIGVLLEVHMLERLQTFYTDFLRALEGVDLALLYPIYAPSGRDSGEGDDLFQQFFHDLQASSVPSQIVPSPNSLQGALEAVADELDVVVAFSAGKLDGNLRRLVS